MKATKQNVRFCLAILVVFLCVSSLVLGQTGWKAGLARVEITPKESLWMSGYGARKEPARGTLSKLYAKVLALSDGGTGQAVLVTADLIGFRAEFVDPMVELISQRTGLKRRQILFNASHTHTGPYPTLSTRPDIPPAEISKSIAYTQRLQQQIVTAVEEALNQMEPAQLSWSTGVIHFVMNRREFTDDGVKIGFNPRGHVDRSVPVLKVMGSDGSLRAVLFGAACHNTTLTGEHLKYSGDYAGFAQQYIEKLQPSAQAMFVLGCAGDANPYPRGQVHMAEDHGRELGTEVLRVLQGELHPVQGPLRVEFENVKLPLQTPPSEQEVQRMAGESGIRGWTGKRMREMLDRGQPLPSHYEAPFALWQFGDDLTLVGISGEVVVDYVSLVEQALGPTRLWIAGYCNDVFGYLPSARVLDEGGYETRGLYHGGIGFFAPSAQEVVVRAVRDLARRAGRQIP